MKEIPVSIFPLQRKMMWDFKVCLNSVSEKRLQYIVSLCITLLPPIGGDANKTTERPATATVQTGAGLFKADSNRALAVVERKILHILLFCFACSSRAAYCSICINTTNQNFCCDLRTVLSECNNTLPVSKNLSIFQYTHRKLVVYHGTRTKESKLHLFKQNGIL